MAESVGAEEELSIGKDMQHVSGSNYVHATEVSKSQSSCTVELSETVVNMTGVSAARSGCRMAESVGAEEELVPKGRQVGSTTMIFYGILAQIRHYESDR
jgi:hypothetical protein